MRQCGLLLNLSKCSFGQPEVEFLGHRISEGGASHQAIGGHSGLPKAA
jgi:hypothetical protein